MWGAAFLVVQQAMLKPQVKHGMTGTLPLLGPGCTSPPASCGPSAGIPYQKLVVAVVPCRLPRVCPLVAPQLLSASKDRRMHLTQLPLEQETAACN